MDTYINNYRFFTKAIIYDFNLGDGGIGDYIKFFMIILKDCIKNNIKIYYKINNIEIEKYIKFKYDIINITNNDMLKLTNYTIKTPYDYYHIKTYKGNISLNEVFYFANDVKLNVKNIIHRLPTNYISIHLRMGDKFLETDKNFVLVKNDTRSYSDNHINKFIENNKNKNILFFCDNMKKKNELKKKYKNIIITHSNIGHTSLSNTTSKQFLDAITEFYILSNSQLIFGASCSGFSEMAAKFKNIKYTTPATYFLNNKFKILKNVRCSEEIWQINGITFQEALDKAKNDPRVKALHWYKNNGGDGRVSDIKGWYQGAGGDIGTVINNGWDTILLYDTLNIIIL